MDKKYKDPVTFIQECLKSKLNCHSNRLVASKCDFMPKVEGGNQKITVTDMSPISCYT